MVAVFWLLMAELRCDSVFHRVESASNIADGPTRPDKEGCQILGLVGAVEQNAFLAGWLVDLWHPYADDVLGKDEILVAVD